EKPGTDGASSSLSGSSGNEGDKNNKMNNISKGDGSSDNPLTQGDEVVTEERKPSEEEEPEQHNVNKRDAAPTGTHDSQARQKEIQLPTTEVNGQSSTEDTVTVQQLHHVQDDHAESRPPSLTANGDAANNEAEKSTERGIPNSVPAADGAGTREEKQNENKEANPMQEPVEATAAKTQRRRLAAVTAAPRSPTPPPLFASSCCV
ncbi:mucin-associated surface protein (MASP), putative, partial [Trypanosoma cruzi marinkellei]